MTEYTERGKNPSSQKSQDRIKKEKRARKIAISSGSQITPELVAQTLGIYKTKGQYFLKYVDIISSPTTTDSKIIENTDVLYYNQFIEAINALRHNCKFIAMAGKLNKIHSVRDKATGEISTCLIDLEYLKDLKFEYDKDILSITNSSSTSNSVPVDEILFENLLCNILNTSIKIINNLENRINFETLSNKIKGFDDSYTQVQQVKATSIANADAISEAIKSGVLSLDSLHDEIVKPTTNNEFSL